MLQTSKNSMAELYQSRRQSPVEYKQKVDTSANMDGAFHIVSSQITENYTRILRKHVLPYLELRNGLRLRELRVLNCVFRYNDGLKASDVSKIMCIDPATVSRAIAILDKRGLLSKQSSYEDGRAVLLVLTDEGLAVAKEFREKALQVYSFLENLVGIDIHQDYFEKILEAAELIKKRTMKMEEVHPRYLKNIFDKTDEPQKRVLKMTSY